MQLTLEMLKQVGACDGDVELACEVWPALARGEAVPVTYENVLVALDAKLSVAWFCRHLLDEWAADVFDQGRDEAGEAYRRAMQMRDAKHGATWPVSDAWRTEGAEIHRRFHHDYATAVMAAVTRHDSHQVPLSIGAK